MRRTTIPSGSKKRSPTFVDTISLTHFLILVGGATAILAVLMLAYHTLRRSSRPTTVIWIVTQGVGFLLAFVSSVVAIGDFLSSAGQFG